MRVGLETYEDFAPTHILVVSARDFFFDAEGFSGVRGGDVGGVVDAFVEDGAGASAGGGDEFGGWERGVEEVVCGF